MTSEGASSGFSPEEVRTIELVARGNTDHAIAKEMNVSVSTVKRRIHTASTRLGTRSRAALVMSALSAGLIEPLGEDEPKGSSQYAGEVGAPEENQ